MKKLVGLALVMGVSLGGAAVAAPAHPEATHVAAAHPIATADRASQAAEALSHGDNLEALARADEALRSDPKSGWAHYNRAAALAGLKRVDEALAAYDQAVANFAANDARGRSLALWGKAHVLYRTGRCDEAAQAFGDYAKLVGTSDPQSTTMASERASSCHPAKGGAQTAAVAATPSAKSAADEAVVIPKTEEKSSLPSLAKP
jgi:tetratricopeptide (TPR) repeat protein